MNSERIRFRYRLSGRAGSRLGGRRCTLARRESTPTFRPARQLPRRHGRGQRWSVDERGGEPPDPRGSAILAHVVVSDARRRRRASAPAGFTYHRRVAALEGARAAQENFARQLIDSQEHERRRIAAELHDSLGQHLIVIKNRALLGSMKSIDGRKNNSTRSRRQRRNRSMKSSRSPTTCGRIIWTSWASAPRSRR